MSPHRKKRGDLSSNMEDYLETIYLQDIDGNSAKVKNIADAMGVSKPSVTEALSVLQDRGLLSHEKYGGIELTDRGRAAASQIYFRHKLFSRFIHDVLDVPKEIAEDDACKVEHLVSDTTVKHVSGLMDFLNEQSNSDSPFADFLPKLHDYLRDEKGERQ